MKIRLKEKRLKDEGTGDIRSVNRVEKEKKDKEEKKICDLSHHISKAFVDGRRIFVACLLVLVMEKL